MSREEFTVELLVWVEAESKAAAQVLAEKAQKHLERMRSTRDATIDGVTVSGVRGDEDAVPAGEAG